MPENTRYKVIQQDTAIVMSLFMLYLEHLGNVAYM